MGPPPLTKCPAKAPEDKGVEVLLVRGFLTNLPVVFVQHHKALDQIQEASACNTGAYPGDLPWGPTTGEPMESYPGAYGNLRWEPTATTTYRQPTDKITGAFAHHPRPPRETYIAANWGEKYVGNLGQTHPLTIWSPGLTCCATCTIFRTGSVPGAFGARRGPRRAENRPTNPGPD